MNKTSKALFLAFRVCIGLVRVSDLDVGDWDDLGFDYYKLRELGFPTPDEVKSAAANIVILAIRDGVEE